LPHPNNSRKLAIKRHNQLANRKVIWLVGASAGRHAHARALKRQAETSGLFSKIVLEVPRQQAIEQYLRLFPYRYQLLDAESRLMLETQPEALLARNLELLYGPLGQMQAASLERDPLLLFNRYFSSQNPVTFNLEQGVVVLYDGGKVWALLLAELMDADLPLDKLVVAGPDRKTQQIKSAGGNYGIRLAVVHGLRRGPPKVRFRRWAWAPACIVTAASLSAASGRYCVVAAASGLVAALVVCILVFGISLLVFGASLIGG
jgi:hypothetical protein